MNTWIVREVGGHWADGTAPVKLLKNGDDLGEMSYPDAQRVVMADGGREDVYREEYVGGFPPVQLTVQYLFDSEARWLETMAELDALDEPTTARN